VARSSLDRFKANRTDHAPPEGRTMDERGGKILTGLFQSEQTDHAQAKLREGRGPNEAPRLSADCFEANRTDHAPAEGGTRDERGDKTVSEPF